MSIIAKKTKSDFEPAPEGLWPAVCCDVVDKGMEQTPWGESHKVQIRWELDAEPKRENGKAHMAVNNYTLSLHEKSRLRPMLEAWRGRKFTQEELDGFDLEVLVGVNCQVQIIHAPSQDGTIRARVQAVVPASRGTVKMRVDKDYVRQIDREKRAGFETHPNGDLITDDDIPF